MPERTNEEIVQAYVEAYRIDDRAALAGLRHPDWILEYPQSGERIRGHSNDQAIAEHYPGGIPHVDSTRVVGSEDHWVVTPSYTVERVRGSGDAWWVEARMTYADGSVWFSTMILDLREGKVWRETTFWAEPFEPPAWRAPWVERIPEA